MFVHEKLLKTALEKYGKFEFHKFQSIENCFQSIEWNSDQSIWFDWYSIASQSFKCYFLIDFLFDWATIEYQMVTSK